MTQAKDCAKAGSTHSEQSGYTKWARRSTHYKLSKLMQSLPASAQSLADIIGVEAESVRVWLRHMRAAGIVGVDGIDEHGRIVWVQGTGVGYNRTSAKAAPEVLSLFISAWRRTASRTSPLELAAHLGKSYQTACRIIYAMRLAGVLRIAGWRRANNAPYCIYDRLPAPDVPRPLRQRHIARLQRERLERIKTYREEAMG